MAGKGCVSEPPIEPVVDEVAVAATELPRYAEWRNRGSFRERNIVGLYKLFAGEVG